MHTFFFLLMFDFIFIIPEKINYKSIIIKDEIQRATKLCRLVHSLAWLFHIFAVVLLFVKKQIKI
jgi:hypothetical protein